MKKRFFRLLAGVFACTACLAGGAKAVNTAQATVWQGSSVYVEGQAVVCVNEQGACVALLRYQDSTYMPVRSAGEWMGKRVEWDGITQSVALGGSVRPLFHSVYDVSPAAQETPGDMVTVTVRPDLGIYLDGVRQSFVNARQQAVYPLMYQGVAYLPLRNIGELSGKEVAWVRPSRQVEIIYMRTPLSAAQKEQADAYAKTLGTSWRKIEAASRRISTDTQETQDVTGQLDAITDGLTAIRNTPRPPVPLLTATDDKLRQMIPELEASVAILRQALQDGQPLTQPAGVLTVQTEKMGAWIVQMRDVIDQTGSVSLSDIGDS